MQIVRDVLHTRHGNCHKANIDNERDSGEDQGESSDNQRAEPKTAVLAECCSGRADHYKKDKAAEYRVED